MSRGILLCSKKDAEKCLKCEVCVINDFQTVMIDISSSNKNVAENKKESGKQTTKRKKSQFRDFKQSCFFLFLFFILRNKTKK